MLNLNIRISFLKSLKHVRNRTGRIICRNNRNFAGNLAVRLFAGTALTGATRKES